MTRRRRGEEAARTRSAWPAIPVAAALVLLPGAAGDLAGQEGAAASSTLRYGTGLLDVPIAAVAPHLGVTGTFSAFSVDIPERLQVGPSGEIIGESGPWSRWFTDGAVTVGLFDRAEVGVTLQSFAAPDSGGSMVGGFGQVLLLDPAEQDGLGVALGARYLTSPRFEGSPYEGEYRPGRLGFADSRLRRSYSSGSGSVETSFTPYAVASGSFPGFDVRFLPRHGFTFALGWGGGLFADGGDLPWYASSSSGGWFLGGAGHVEVRDGTMLHLQGEYNGFDTNLGAQVDVGGIRVGTFVLGVNHDTDRSTYRSRKWGVSAAFAFCPVQGGRCRPRLRNRSGPDTVQLPAPPPDTVRLPPATDTLGKSRSFSGAPGDGRGGTASYAPVRSWRWPSFDRGSAAFRSP